MEIIWLSEAAREWADQVHQGRAPHALLVSGVPGVGKRALVAWMAAQRFGLANRPAVVSHPAEKPTHADLHWIEPEADKRSIGIDQVRALVADIALTSYSGLGKMAVIEPADAMTRSASNSLLKTLEEPAGDALIVLIADRTGDLPATIVSRCQRRLVRPPDSDVAVGWLEATAGRADWRALLELAGGGPLLALESQDLLDEARAMQKEWAAVAGGGASPIDTAQRWARLDLDFVLDWLIRTMRSLIDFTSGVSGGDDSVGLPESVLTRIDRRNMFCYLDSVMHLRSQPAGSYNPQLALESLLIDWATGLRDCQNMTRRGGALPAATID